MERDEIRIDRKIVRCEPFEWPRSGHEPLVLEGYFMPEAIKSALDELFAGTYSGSVHHTLGPTVVIQFSAPGPKPPTFDVEDWRGNRAMMAVSPGDGWERHEGVGTRLYHFRIQLWLQGDVPPQVIGSRVEI